MATCSIIPEKSSRVTHGPKQDGTRASQVDVFLDPDQMRRGEYTVYLHSISKRSFQQPHPIYRNIIIPACPKDKEFITFMRIQHPVQIPTVDPDNVSGPPIIKIENAKRAALCVCNPSFVGVDLDIQDKPIDDQYQISSSECDLTRQGIFASLNPVPTDEEIGRAKARRLAYYKMIFQRMNELWRGDPKKAQDELTTDHHMAAEMFAIDVDWHKISTPKIECPNCGEKIKEGIAFHRVNGDLCVLDWEKAYLAGAVKKENVPEPKRWWKPETLEEMNKEQLKQYASTLGLDIDLRSSRENIIAAIQVAQAK